jgi:hypothetical protein
MEPDRTCIKRILIATNNESRNIGKHIKQHIKRRYPLFSVECETHFSIIKKKLKENVYDWLITTDVLSLSRRPYMYSFSSVLGDESKSIIDHPGKRLAEDWLQKNPTGKAILITSLGYDWDRITFYRQLFPVLFEDMAHLEYTMQIIHAGEFNLPFVHPTILQLDFSKVNEKEDDTYRIQLRDVKGPFYHLISRNILHPSIDFSITNPDRKELTKVITEANKKEIIATWGHTIFNQINRHNPFYDTICFLFKTISQSWSHWPEDKRPFPLIMEIWCDETTLSLPIDLMLPIGDGKNYLLTKIPIIWKLNNPRHETSPDDTFNPVDYKRFSITYSCSKKVTIGTLIFSEITEINAFALKIGNLLGNPEIQIIDISHPKILKREIVTRNKKPNHALLLVTHGIHAGDLSSIIISPSKEDTPFLVTADNLAPKWNEKGQQFIYFNCCQLGYQSQSEEAISEYYGGFSEAVIKQRISREIIANRWSVDAEISLDIVEEFFRSKPTTIYLRSVALLFARLKILNKLRDSYDKKQLDASWLAPVHIVSH